MLAVSLINFLWTSERLGVRVEIELTEKARLASSLFLEARTFMAESYPYIDSAVDIGGFPEFRHLDPISSEKGVKELFNNEEGLVFDEIWLKAPQGEQNILEIQFVLLEKLLNEPSLKEIWDIGIVNGGKTFYHLTPIWVEEPCLHCHSADSNLVFKKEPPVFEPNSLVGVLGLQVPMLTLEKAIKAEIAAQMTFVILLLILSGFVISRFLRTSVEQPLKDLLNVAKEFGQGRLDTPFPSINAPTEIQLIAQQGSMMAGQLRKYYNELENQVLEKTLRLREANQTLEEQKKELERANYHLAEANEIKSEFLASVSHELRTPLTSIIVFVELLLDGIDGPMNEQQKEYLEDILLSSRRLVDPISGLLDTAKTESGKMELYYSHFFIEELIDEVGQKVYPIALAKQIDFQMEFKGNVKEIYGEREKIEQILLNLISDAIKFTPPDGMVLVKIKIEQENLLVLNE